MNMRVNRMINEAVSRFIIKTFESTSEEAYLDMLNILELWDEYKQEHASGYIIDVKLISKKIAEVFPNAKIQDIRIFGLKKKAPRLPPAKKQMTAEELKQIQHDSLVKAKFERYIRSRSIDLRTSPFTTASFASDKQSVYSGSGYTMVCSECSLEDAKEWLSRQEFLYFDESLDKWCFHSRPI